MGGEPTTLKTRRFLLKPPTFDDVGALRGHWALPEVREFLWDNRVVTVNEVAQVVETSMRNHCVYNWGGWVVRGLGQPSRIVGWCGLGVGPLDGSSSSDQLVELTYSVDGTCWGTGVAIEVAAAVLDSVLPTGLLDAVFAGVDRPNLRSVATLQRLGFLPDREVMLDVGPTPYWCLTAARWLSRR